MRMARKDAARQPWLAQRLERKPVKIETAGLATKTARIAWAVMAHNEVYLVAAARLLSSSRADAVDGTV